MSDHKEFENEHEIDEAEEQIDQYSFLRETIKTKQVNKLKFMGGLARMAFFGIVFGIFASFSFFSLRPAWESRFQEPEIPPDPIVLPIHEEEEPQIILPGEPEEDEGEEINGETDSEEDNENENADENVNGNGNDDVSADDSAVDEPLDIVIELTPEHYQEMMEGLRDIALEATRRVVLLRGIREPIDWLFGAGSIDSVVTGVVVWESEQELLILASASIVAGFDQWAVTFANDSQYEAHLLRQDRNLGLAIFSVPLESISEETIENVAVGTLMTGLIGRGDTVIAVGNLSGHGHQFAFGRLSARGYKETIPDRSFTVLATDIAVSPRGTGMLFNQRGDVIGMILPNIGPVPDSPSANAMAMTDVREIVQHLLQGGSIPYVGIYGYTIDEQIAEFMSIPMGVFVTQVVMDSPAMGAGILNGDVIVQIGETETLTIQAYQRALLEHNVGDTVLFRGRRQGAVGYIDIEFEVVLGTLD